MASTPPSSFPTVEPPLAEQGSTNADNLYYKGSLVGCRPELMPLDSHLKMRVDLTCKQSQ